LLGAALRYAARGISVYPVHWPRPTPDGASLAAYRAQLAAGQTPTGAGLARAAGVSERYGQRLLAEFTANAALADHPNGDGRPATPPRTTSRPERAERR
jgi:hypothetical protein